MCFITKQSLPKDELVHRPACKAGRCTSSSFGKLCFHLFGCNPRNLQHFLSAARPTHDTDGAFGQAKLFSEERSQCLIGSTAYRWGRQAHFQGPFFPLYTVLATSW